MVKELGRQKGSSLIEVVIAMVIMALLLTGLNSFLVALINSNVYSKEISAATATGNALLERFRTTEYTTIMTGSDVVKNRYLRSWTVTDDGKEKKVNMAVSWPQTTPKHVIELSTIISKP